MLLGATILPLKEKEKIELGAYSRHRAANLQGVGLYARMRDHPPRPEALKHHLPQCKLPTTQGLIKICDFGWSISSKTMRETFCGTPLYVSPELLKRKNYNNKIDVWSVGILTYELLFGRVPFEIATEKDFVKIVKES